MKTDEQNEVKEKENIKWNATLVEWRNEYGGSAWKESKNSENTLKWNNVNVFLLFVIKSISFRFAFKTLCVRRSYFFSLPLQRNWLLNVHEQRNHEKKKITKRKWCFQNGLIWFVVVSLCFCSFDMLREWKMWLKWNKNESEQSIKTEGRNVYRIKREKKTPIYMYLYAQMTKI